MSPHEYMTKLDNEGTAYTVRFCMQGGPDNSTYWQEEVAVTSHHENWIAYRVKSGTVFVNMSHIIN